MYDLELLDALKEQVLRTHCEYFQSPIIGLWKQNELKDKLSGAAARELVN